MTIYFRRANWIKLFKYGPCKICGRQLLKKLKWICLGRPYHVKFSLCQCLICEGCLLLTRRYDILSCPSAGTNMRNGSRFTAWLDYSPSGKFTTDDFENIFSNCFLSYLFVFREFTKERNGKERVWVRILSL